MSQFCVSQFCTNATFDFVQRFLPKDACDVIDVGCGDGSLCFALVKSGHHPIANEVELSEQLQRSLVKVGVKVCCGNWHEFSPVAVDAVIFSRSLHHLSPVDKAVGRATQCLNRGGRILVEDFAFREVDSISLDWMIDCGRQLLADGLLLPKPDSFVERILASNNPARDWHGDHHEIASAGEMQMCLARCGTMIEQSSAPYLFRYFAESIKTNAKRSVDQVLEMIFQQEQQLMDSGRSKSIGRRWVVEVPPR